MDDRGIKIKTYKALSVVGKEFSAYKVDISFTEAPFHAGRYIIFTKSDKLAADKGLRCFISDVAKCNSKNRK
jgi:hypothetical protein